MIRAACLVALLTSACYASRPPTTSLEVVHEVPAGAVQVWSSPIWGDDSAECTSPPNVIRENAMRRGADVLVVIARPVGGHGAICRAQGYASR